MIVCCKRSYLSDYLENIRRDICLTLPSLREELRQKSGCEDEVCQRFVIGNTLGALHGEGLEGDNFPQNSRCGSLTARVKSFCMRPFRECENVIAIATHRLMYFLRLVLVASLASYILPTVSFAMHGDLGASYTLNKNHGGETVFQSSGTMTTDHVQDDMAMDQNSDDGPSDHHNNMTVHKGCCSDFCLNIAVIGNPDCFRHVRTSLSLAYTNDGIVFVSPIGLHRPPAFRT